MIVVHNIKPTWILFSQINKWQTNRKDYLVFRWKDDQDTCKVIYSPDSHAVYSLVNSQQYSGVNSECQNTYVNWSYLDLNMSTTIQILVVSDLSLMLGTTQELGILEGSEGRWKERQRGIIILLILYHGKIPANK